MSISNFNIADVAAIHGVEVIKQKGGEIFAVCPFCGDRRGKFSIVIEKGNKKNIFHCFNCGEHGGSIELHKRLSSEDYSDADGTKRAAKDIFNALNGNVTFSSNHDKVLSAVTTTTDAERQSDEGISAVYYALLNELTLKDEHKKDLVRRGLTEEDIKRFRFRSTPELKEKYRIINHLLRIGLKLEGVPGFYLNKKGKWDLNIPTEGYLCPVFNGNLIVGFQIRADKPLDKRKYLWLSSSGKQKGVSSTSPVTFLPGQNAGVVIITEGILKASVIYSLLKGTVSVIGVAGVNVIDGIKKYLEKWNGNVYAFIAYDMDKAVKTNDAKELEKTQRIAEAEMKLKDLVAEYNIDSHILTWDFDKDKYWKGNYKGLDDFLLEANREVFIEYILNMAGDVLKVKSFLSNN